VREGGFEMRFAILAGCVCIAQGLAVNGGHELGNHFMVGAGTALLFVVFLDVLDMIPK
jgi:hypothetical protein